MIYRPYEFQQRAQEWVLDKPRCCLFLDMGLGKTVITLTAILQLIDNAEVSKVLVVAPKKVAEATWTQEAAKWEHLHPLRVAKVLGDQKKRIEALQQDADVYVISRDTLVWLVGYYNGSLPFDMLVLDELSSFKSNKSKRFKAVRLTTASFSRVIGLTGTPAPNGLIDLWAEMYCVDMGERLGKFITRYKQAFFYEVMWNGIPMKYTLRKGAEETIRNRISDICLSMQASDYLQLPPLIEHTELVELSGSTKAKYERFEYDEVLDFIDTHTGESDVVLANSAAGLMNKLAQFSNGAVYNKDREVRHIHDEKLERLVELIEAANSNVLVFYQYKHDVPRINKALKGYKVQTYEDEKTLKDWNDGKIEVLLAHPASTAYGLNMQHGGHYIVWFGLTWNLELYVQANARLYRQGQEHPVTIYQLLCRDTVDELVAKALARKDNIQQALLEGLKQLINKNVKEDE